MTELDGRRNARVHLMRGRRTPGVRVVGVGRDRGILPVHLCETGRALGVTLGFLPAVVGAQRATAPATQSTPPPTATLLVPRATTPPKSAAPVGPQPAGPADTMLFMGRQDFRTYQLPAACQHAAMEVEEGAHFADEDTASWAAPKGDTLATATVSLARRCGAHFTPEQVPAGELMPLMHLALIVGDDAKARATAERYLATAHMPGMDEAEARRWALYDVDTTYLNAKPKRLAAAEAITARLDSLGPTAAMQRNKAHGDLMGIARARFDTARLEREALATITASGQMTAEDLATWDGGGTGGPGVQLVWLTELFRDPQGALERTKARVLSAGLQPTDWDTFLILMRGMRLDWIVAQIGKPVPPLKAQYWVETDSSRRQWPVPGTISVYLQAIQARDTSLAPLETEAVHMAMWRRMLKKYGAALQVTVMAKSQGSFRDGPPLSPGEEAARIAKFYREELGVPVTVALDETPVKQLPDGRRVWEKAPFETDPYYGMRFIMTDRTGKLVLAGQRGEIAEEPILDGWIAREVRR